MKKNLIIFVIILIVAGTFVVSQIWQRESSSEKPLTKITMAVPKSLPYPKPEVIARDKGFFKEEGLDVNLVYFNSGKEALNALLSNDAQLANSGETPLIYLWFTDQDVQVVTTMAEGYWLKTIGRKDRGIEKVTDLKGKKVASPKGTTGEFGLSELLRSNGLSMKDIEFVNLQTLSLPNALANGDIDAYAAWEMHIYNGQKVLGDNAVVFTVDKNTYREYQNVYGKKDWLSQNPETMKKFLRALIKAEKYISDNPDEAIEIAAKETGFSKDALSTVRDNYKIGIKLDINAWINQAEREGQWINEQKLEAERKPLPDYRKQINDSFLKVVDPLRVQ